MMVGILGLGVGTSSLVSRAIGRGDQREIRHITTSSLLMSVLLGADEETLPLIREYMNIWLAGMPFVGQNSAAVAKLLGGLLAWVWIMRTLKDEEASLSRTE